LGVGQFPSPGSELPHLNAASNTGVLWVIFRVILGSITHSNIFKKNKTQQTKQKKHKNPPAYSDEDKRRNLLSISITSFLSMERPLCL